MFKIRNNPFKQHYEILEIYNNSAKVVGIFDTEIDANNFLSLCISFETRLSRRTA